GRLGFWPGGGDEPRAQGLGPQRGRFGARGGGTEQGKKLLHLFAERTEPGLDGSLVDVWTEGRGFDGNERWRGRCNGDGFKRRDRFARLGLILEDLARAGDRVALVVEQALDAQRHLDVALPVEALAGAAFVGLELRELGLPEAQYVGGDLAEPRDIADPEVELVRNLRSDGLANWLMGSHAIAVTRPGSPGGACWLAQSIGRRRPGGQ